MIDSEVRFAPPRRGRGSVSGRGSDATVGAGIRVRPTPSTSIDGRIEGLGSEGHELSAEDRGFFEPRFGHDFSRVRVHHDSRAGALAHDLSARAFTLRRHVVFAPGHFAPNTASGRRLLAHELAHVVQGSRDPHSTIIRRAVIDPSVRVPARRRVIAGALRRVPFVVASALSVLGRLRSGTATARQRRALRESFGIDVGDPDSARHIARIARGFEQARDRLRAPTTLISVIRNRAFLDAWGYAPIGEERAPYDTEIRVGTAFFRASPRNPRFASTMRRCASPPGDQGLLRALTLIHEVLHWINGPGHMTTGRTTPTPRLQLGPGSVFGPRRSPRSPSLLGGSQTGPTRPSRFGFGLGGLTLEPNLGPSSVLAPSPAPTRDVLILNPYRYEMFVLWIRCGEDAAAYSQGVQP